MIISAFIFGAEREHQLMQRNAIKTFLKTSAYKPKWITEPKGRERRDVDDRAELHRAARYAREHKAPFIVQSLSGFFPRRWQALMWLKYQVDMHDMEILVTDDPTISKGSLHVLSAAADV